MATVWFIGDPCVPVKQPDHPVMFVYDLSPSNGVEWVLCNWAEGRIMHARAFRVEELKRSRRDLARR